MARTIAIPVKWLSDFSLDIFKTQSRSRSLIQAMTILTSLKIVLGKETLLKTMQFVGELTKEAIENIEAAKNHLEC